MNDNSLIIQQLNAAQHAEFMRRFQIVHEWHRRRTLAELSGVRIGFAEQCYLSELAGSGNKICRATLRLWSKAYRVDGPRGLLDGRWSARRSTGTPNADRDYSLFLAEMQRLYCGPGLLSMDVCFELARETAELAGWIVPTLRHAKKFIRREILPSLTRERGLIERPSSGDRSTI